MQYFPTYFVTFYTQLIVFIFRLNYEMMKLSNVQRCLMEGEADLHRYDSQPSIYHEKSMDDRRSQRRPVAVHFPCNYDH